MAALVLTLPLPAGASNYSGASSHQRIQGVQLAGLFGESDEEKAARQHESDQDAQIADLTQRIHDLERALQQATGQNEQLAQRLQELSQRVDQQRKNFDYKLCALAAQQIGAGTSADESGSGLPCDTAGSTSPPGGTAQAGAPAGGGTLGTLPGGQATQASTRAQFDEAMNLLARAQYDQARAAFQAFADANPKDPLAPQADYWVGKIAFVQRDYAGASQEFAQLIKSFPTSAQGPEATLMLGQSLIALGKTKEGCVFLGAIKTKYKHAPDSILAQAATVYAASCKRSD